MSKSFPWGLSSLRDPVVCQANKIDRWIGRECLCQSVVRLCDKNDSCWSIFLSKTEKYPKVFWTQISRRIYIKAPTSLIQLHLCLQHMKFENALLNSLATWPGNDLPDLPWIYHHQIQVRSAMWRRNCVNCLLLVSPSVIVRSLPKLEGNLRPSQFYSTSLHEFMICLITKLSKG